MPDFRVAIESIPHSSQRYETIGDWYDRHGVQIIRVSQMSDWRREALVAVHELIEWLIAKHNGVTEAQVDEFDFKFEAARRPGNTDEPGDNPECPVYREHQIATAVERLLAVELGVDWNDYERECQRFNLERAGRGK